MQIGRYKVTLHEHGKFRLDGGAMFGSVPKALWSRVAPADEANRILMTTRSLLIEHAERKMLVDTGCGDKWNDKTRAIFDLPDFPYVPVQGVTDVLLTHLHFDHAGGNSRFERGVAVPNYPNAIHHVPRENLANARDPHPRERASYLAENFEPLASVELRQTEDGEEIWPGLTVHRSDGHTRGLMWLTLADGGETLAYPSDLIPTSHHLPLSYAMGYDMCAQTVIEEKRQFLEQAVAGSWLVVFEHDPQVAAARLTLDDRGRAVLVSGEPGSR